MVRVIMYTKLIKNTPIQFIVLGIRTRTASVNIVLGASSLNPLEWACMLVYFLKPIRHYTYLYLVNSGTLNVCTRSPSKVG